MTLHRRTALTLLAAPALLSAAGARAQEAYPNRGMRFIVPVAAGGSADAQARVVAQRLAERWGQPVVVENRPGANGIVAAQAFLQTPPDGHTVFATPSGPIAINPHLYRRLPYDPFRDFAMTSLISVIPLVLVVQPSLPANNLQEFLALSRRMGDQLKFASAGIGTPSHLTIAMTRAMGRGGEATHVPFGGSAPALTSLVGGQTMAMWDAAFSAAPFVRDGRMKAIAVAHTERLALLPDVPTTVEQGVPDLISATWMSLAVHAATPADRVRRLAAEVDSILRVPELREMLAAQGAIVRGGTAEEFLQFARAESEKWGRLVRETGATAD
ncbi:Bug family tripartite tricarboxylate transporter substrate binding protein [Falsiroseomonas oryziterrae]|uniref:Bug family tripartite tricarboxylate transporter substrate binding protein n=1 Tax=Falsiroseomonas oryziterrae TaxID=2911368 RepID=UPI001F3BE13A|nr:tripartite tricarboxylate transporter substrate binding protein [Roseomonas sp. NPKOSM-4]